MVHSLNDFQKYETEGWVLGEGWVSGANFSLSWWSRKNFNFPARVVHNTYLRWALVGFNSKVCQLVPQLFLLRKIQLHG
jgi:hypothetical protein